VVEVNIALPLNAITPKFIGVLKQMAPFGPENPKPTFEARNLYVSNSLSSFKDKHVRFLVSQHGSECVFQVVGFDMGEHYARLANGDLFRMAFTIEENTYNGITSVQLRAKDIKFE
jgi:single-stranded-DNA-specific exonuclease